MRDIYRNYEMRRITFKIILVYLIFALSTYFFTEYRLRILSKNIIMQNTAVVGTVLNKNPQLEQQLVACYTREVSRETLKRGQEILNSYGYGLKTPLSNIAVFKNFYSNFSFNILFIMSIFFIVIMIIVILEYKFIFNKIKDISKATEKVVEGEFYIRIKEENEGEFNILAHQFNVMTNRLENSICSLQKEKKFLKDIISDISHQLKTPLASLMIFNELFIEGAIKDEESKKSFYNKSKIQLERMEWLIKNLLKIAKIEAKSIEFEKNNNSLISTINKALIPLKVKWMEKNQKVNVEIEEDIVFKHDTNWTAEAITNIIKNSIEHTECNGEINISASKSPLCTSIIISDNGKGIPKDELPHIFERFYKSKKNSNSDSIGIGLALCKSIIESQEGSIQAQSVEGEGSRFVITFLNGII